MENIYSAGVDIGSTTAKLVIFNGRGNMVFARYRRHQAKTEETALAIFQEALSETGDVKLDLAVTGSAGMGLAETFGFPFVQEVVASAHLIKKDYPEPVFNQTLLESAVSFNSWKNRLKIRLLMEKTAARELEGKIEITPDEILKCYEENQAQYVSESGNEQDQGEIKVDINEVIIKQLRRQKKMKQN